MQSLSVFAFYLENEAFAQELPFLKNVLKLSILPIESVFIIEFDVKLKVKIAEIFVSISFAQIRKPSIIRIFFFRIIECSSSGWWKLMSDLDSTGQTAKIWSFSYAVKVK